MTSGTNADTGPVNAVVVKATKSAHFCLLTSAESELPTDMGLQGLTNMTSLGGTST